MHESDKRVQDAIDAAGVQSFVTAARHCAGVILESASFIQKELVNVRIDADLKEQLERICTQMIATKHDVVHEIFEIAEALDSGTEPSEIQSRISNITSWIVEDIKDLHQIVMALDATSKEDRGCSLAYMLVSESATNVLHAFSIVMESANSLQN